MALDLTYKIKRILSGEEWTAELNKKKFEVCACDEFDEYYTIRTSEGDALWVNDLIGSDFRVDKITSPEKGVIQIKVKKSCPDCNDDGENFLKKVGKYFSDTLPNTGFRMTEKHLTDRVDSSYMAHNSEGNEVGWVEQESNAYIGTTYTLDGPTFGEEEYYTEIPEDWKRFIIRKLEAIFHKKGAWCEEKECLNGLKHYKFKISNY